MRILIISLLLLCCVVQPSIAANITLEITNIKASGTGTPAIPSTNRIFRAYTGIEYNIRAAVIGGLYPYTYSLSGQPSGMTINSRTGEISWQNPQSSSGTITLTVTDSESTTATATWAITVGTSTDDFIFVDASYSETETGSITQPYSSLASMLAGETNNNKIVYFRAGTYQMIDYNSVSDHVMNMEASPRTLLAYPGESVIFQGDGTGANAYRIYAMNGPFYVDGIEFNDCVNYCFFTDNDSYHTFRRNTFEGLTVDTAVNNNMGFIYWSNSGSPGRFSVVQDNEFSHWAGSSAIGSMYYMDKTLIENNYIHDTDGASISGINNGISLKYGSDYSTIRGNIVSMNSGNLFGGMNAMFNASDDIEICYNFFNAPNRGGPFLDYDGAQGRAWLWRNTFVGDVSWRTYTGGPYYLNNNVIVNPNTPFDVFVMEDFISHPNYFTISQLDLTQTDNLKGLPAAGIVDTAGKLTESYEQYIGTRGWQLADGTTPMEDAAVTAIITGGSVVGGVIVH